MRAVIQRVLNASVLEKDVTISSIDTGSLVLIGFHTDDTEKEMDYIISKILGARIFNDENDMMNRSVTEISGEVLVVSQFTLYGDMRKGKRPSYSSAMKPAEAEIFYNKFIDKIRTQYDRIKTGVFGGDMKVTLTNWGPVTIILDSN